MKFKVGDKVKAITNHYDITSEEMGWEGIIVNLTGTRFNAKTTKCIEKSEIGCTYEDLNENDFELIAPFRIDDLEFADIMTLRNGDKYVFVEGTMYGEDSDYDCDCDDIEYDYESNGIRKYSNKDYDIMKVERKGEIIFERDEIVREMTVEEISKALGYDVKIVKEREE